jgi:hypothetical protein
MMISEYYNNLPEKVQKILKGAFIAILGLLATFLEEQIPHVNFGNYAVYAVALNSIIVNIIRQYISFCISTDKS